MATYNFTDGSIQGQTIPPETTVWENAPVVLRNIVDCSKQALASSGDVGQVLNIPAGTTVITAWIRILTPESSGATVNLGYGGAATKWGSGLTVSSAAGSVLGATIAPAYFASDDTIDIVAGGTADCDGLKAEVCALCIKSLDQY